MLSRGLPGRYVHAANIDSHYFSVSVCNISVSQCVLEWQQLERLRSFFQFQNFVYIIHIMYN